MSFHTPSCRVRTGAACWVRRRVPSGMACTSPVSVRAEATSTGVPESSARATARDSSVSSPPVTGGGAVGGAAWAGAAVIRQASAATAAGIASRPRRGAPGLFMTGMARLSVRKEPDPGRARLGRSGTETSCSD